MKDIELKYCIRPLDLEGVADSRTLETNDIEEALLKLKTLSHSTMNKYVIVATSDDDE